MMLKNRGTTSSVTLRVPPFRGPAGPFSLKTVHWTVFRALEPEGGLMPPGIKTKEVVPRYHTTWVNGNPIHAQAPLIHGLGG